MIEALESALQYAGRGWPVLPCKDKVPLVRSGVHTNPRSHDDRTMVAQVASQCRSRVWHRAALS
jgi:hypothetical protein